LDSITATAASINEAQDLSRRIGLPPGKDEFSQLAAAFDQLLQRLERSFESEKQFTADASHELRTPVSIITGACEYAERYDETGEERQETIAMIHRQADKMSQLISQLMSMTRLEQGTEPVRLERVSLDKLLRSLCGDLACDPSRLVLEVPNGLTVEADPSLLARLLRNLVENGFKYGRPDGHVWISAAKEGGEVLLEKPVSDSAEDNLTDKSVLNVKDILEFANTVDLSLVTPLLDRQIDCNSAIAEEGLRGDWGANIGSTLLNNYPEDIRLEARAYAAAGSDARMSGCEMPVVILSGSGNQGMTASLPVIRYAKHLGVDKDKLYRALLVSDLVTVHQKSGIGRLSAYCGAVSAGVGSGAAIAYLVDGSYEAVAHTIINALAIISGTICDGAKPSCAAKIASSVEAGILGYQMYKGGQTFKGGDGILAGDVDATIANIGVLAREGMQQTDKTILEIMTQRGDC
jgi:hypothetical protein